MIEKLIVNSKTTEVNGVTRLLSNAYQQSGLNKDKVLDPTFVKLDAKNTELSAAIDRSKSESILAGKNETRAITVRGVGHLINGYTYHPDKEISSAAVKVETVFKKYGYAITGESYVTESAHIVSMLGDFAAPDIQEAIALLSGVAENIAAMQAAQTDFENTQTELAEDLAEENNLPNASALKKEVATLINDDLVVFLRYSERFQPDKYGAFAATVAKIISDNNIQVKKRHKNNDSESDSDNKD